MTADEKKLHDYLDEQNVDKGDVEMQYIVINSFYNQCDQDNDDEWEEKVDFAVVNFVIFREYVQKIWLDNRDYDETNFIKMDDDDTDN